MTALFSPRQGDSYPAGRGNLNGNRKQVGAWGQGGGCQLKRHWALIYARRNYRTCWCRVVTEVVEAGQPLLSPKTWAWSRDKRLSPAVGLCSRRVKLRTGERGEEIEGRSFKKNKEPIFMTSLVIFNPLAISSNFKSLNTPSRDVTGSPVAKTLCSRCQGPGFDP